jgi:hypothetical protein
MSAGAGALPTWGSVTSGVSSVTAAGAGITASPTTGAVVIQNTGVLSFNTRTGAVTLTSADVTTALGYTPQTGTVTSVSVATTNGVSGSVATATTTPAITLTLGAITPTSVTTATASVTGTLTHPGGGTAVAPTSYGNLGLAGTNTGGWAGIAFNNSYHNQTFMVSLSSDQTGMYDPSDGWIWRFDGSSLAVGTVPAASISAGTAAISISGNAATATTATNANAVITYGGRTDNANYPVVWSNPGGTSYQPNYSCNSVTINSSTGTLNATIFNSSSDINIKKNVRKIENALDIIQSLNGVRFDWKDTGEASAGIIAQDVEQQMPELVKDNDGIKAVNHNGIIGALVEAIKEMNATHKAEIAALKAEIELLKGK